MLVAVNAVGSVIVPVAVSVHSFASVTVTVGDPTQSPVALAVVPNPPSASHW